MKLGIYLFLFSFMTMSMTAPMRGTKKDNSYNEVMSVINNYSKTLKKQHGIKLTGYGLHYAGPNKIYDGKIHEIDLGYCIENRMDFDEARQLFYSVVDGLLNEINQAVSLKSYFYNYPITYQDLYFRLNFDYEKKRYLKKNNVSMIAIFCNEIQYMIAEEDGGNAQLEVKQLNSNVNIISGISPTTRCIIKSLPE